MIVLIGPSAGGVAHVSRSVATHWSATDVAVQRLLVSEDGQVVEADCSCAVSHAASSMPIAFRAAKAAWAHRVCLRAADSIHLELGRTSVGAFWFGLAATVLRRRVNLVTVLHDVPTVVLHPAAALMPHAPGWRDALAYRIVAPLLDRLVLRRLKRRTTAAVVLSAGAATTARRLGWAKVRQVSHGADPMRLDGCAPADATYVLLAGFLGPGKGLDVLARAWPDVHGELPLLIAGGHSANDEAWVAGVRDTFDRGARPPTWLGYVSDDEFGRLIANAAVVVIPYESSNPASGVLIRALVAGRAVVATRVDAVAGEIVDEVDGLLVTPGRADELAAALQRLLDAPQLRDQLGHHAGERAAERHSWATHVAVLTALHPLPVVVRAEPARWLRVVRVDLDAA